MPRKSCMKPSASLPSHSSSYNTRTIEDDEELMDSEDEEEYESRGYDVYDDEEEERSSRSRSIDVEEEKVYEDKYEHDEEKYEPQVIQKLLAAQPAKSILKPAAENESNIYYISTSESRGTSKSLSDSEPEQPERSINKARVDEKFVVRENGRIVADFTAIFTPPENLSDEQLEAMEKRRKELGVLFPPFTGTRQDANARYKNIKKIADENGKMYWDGSASQKATISFSATRKRVNKDKIRQIYSRANYESSLKKQQPKKK
uniref:Fcf2 pre-rRNA processing C-terminal domain-containing protein n=1 Tax=Panagrolaimus sp. PS1159 TaxID=55785 RepID=A0AC35FZJ3_9BILA